MTAGSVASNLPRINVYIEPELKEAAENLAKKQRRSLSALVCVLLEEAVKKELEKTLVETEIQKSATSGSTSTICSEDGKN